MERYAKGVLPLSILFIFLWSSGWIGAKYGLGYVGIYSLLMWRYLFVVLTLLLLVSLFRAWRPLDKNELLSHAFVGILSHAVYLSASLSSITMGVSTGLVAFALALQPLLTAVISSPFTGEKVSPRQWAGVTLGLLAVLLVVGDRISLGGSWPAYTLLLVSTLGITLATLIDRRLEISTLKSNRPRTPILLILLIHCSAATLVFIPLAGYFENFETIWQPSLVFAIVWLGWVVSLAAFGLMFVLLRRMSTTKVSSLMYLSPPTTMLIAYFAFGERLTTVDIAGLLIAASAVWIVSSREPVPVSQQKTLPTKESIVE